MMGLASAALDDAQAPVALLEAIEQTCAACEKREIKS
jgi:hypothetical protein